MSDTNFGDSDETSCGHNTKRARTETEDVDPMKPTFIYLMRDDLYDNAFRYAGRTGRTEEERWMEHVNGVSCAALLELEVKRRMGGKHAITLDNFVRDPRLPDGVPHHRRKAFEVVAIDVNHTVYSDLRNPLGLNASIGDNVGEMNVRAVRDEYLQGYRWPASSTALRVATELAAARQRVEIFEDVYNDIGHLDPSFRGQLAEARTARDKLERLEAAANPFERARMHKQDYAAMKPGARVSVKAAFNELNGIVEMEPDNEDLQREYRVVWCRRLHPDYVKTATLSAHKVLVVFMDIEEFCAEQIEDALHAKHYEKNYDVHANRTGAGGNHFMAALVLRDFLDDYNRMPSGAATERKNAGLDAVAEERLGVKMSDWKRRGRKDQTTYDVVLRHYDAFAKWNADVKNTACDQSNLLLQRFLAGYGIQKYGNDVVDADAKLMQSSCRACGKHDANYTIVLCYLKGSDNATSTALDKWEEIKPEDAAKIASYRAVHGKNRQVLRENGKAAQAKRNARREAYKAKF